MLVEVKMTARRTDPIEGASGVKARAIQDLADLDPGRLFDRMVFADRDVERNDVEAVRRFAAGAI
jgi:hypothetical protein